MVSRVTGHAYIASYENSDVLVFESSRGLLGYVEAADIQEITVWDDRGLLYELTSPDDVDVQMQETGQQDVEGLRNALDRYIARIVDDRGLPRPEWPEDDLRARVGWLSSLPPRRTTVGQRLSAFLHGWRP